MGDKTGIQWTDATWNPLAAYDRETGKRGWFCTRVSDGCKNCYASTINKRLGNGHDYQLRNLAKIEWRLVNLDQPERWRRPRRIFVNSMTDLFHEDVPDALIHQVFAAMAAAPQHTFQVLTKRTERMAKYSRDWYRPGALNDARINFGIGGNSITEWPLPNVWLGTSVENQAAADERIPHLLNTVAAVRFLSCEPLLGPLDIAKQLEQVDNTGDYLPDRIRWVIVGGESGTNARPFDIAWAKSLIAQCKDAGVACFVKQLGARSYSLKPRTPDSPDWIEIRDSHGGDWTEWPEHLRVREWPVAVEHVKA